MRQAIFANQFSAGHGEKIWDKFLMNRHTNVEDGIKSYIQSFMTVLQFCVFL